MKNISLKALISALTKAINLSLEYIKYSNVFLVEKTSKLLKYSKYNYAINLDSNKALFRLIYNLLKKIKDTIRVFL